MPRLSQFGRIASERIQRLRNNYHINRLATQVNTHTYPDPEIKPVLFFNASTRLVGLSLNAAFALLSSWAVRLQKVPVVQFVCQSGMSRCVLGTDRNDFDKNPPCKACTAQSRWLFSTVLAIPFTYQADPELIKLIGDQSLDDLKAFQYRFPNGLGAEQKSATEMQLPLGELVLPSIRWVLRRHHLEDNEATRFLYREYILSASRVAAEFSKALDMTGPQAVVLFNGQFFPEATARWIAKQRGIRTITHEVGLQPLSAFFTTGEATVYPLQVPEDFELSEDQNARLDAYLSQRFQGEFSMAGVDFWPQMEGLDEGLLQKAANFRQIVPVFTNVIFDTSQPHSNVVFPHMFAWLDLVLKFVRDHPETLFVLRAHPDEDRPGKASQESVSQWVDQKQATSLTNLVFVAPSHPLSSYELIQRSKFVMVYNSTIGLEASIMGKPVLCAGRARYTQLPTVFFPSTPQEFSAQAEIFLTAGTISVPAEFKHNARRFLYYQLYRSSLPFNEYLEAAQMPGFVRLRKFSSLQLSPEISPTMRVLIDGILKGDSFLLGDEPHE
jgi:hypothetical protein